MKITRGYSFDDVLLVPKKSTINTRAKIDVSTDLGRGIVLTKPIVSANMKHVTGHRMAYEIALHGGLAILHRFESEEDRFYSFIRAIHLSDFGGEWVPGRQTHLLDCKIGMSFGINEHEKAFFYSVAKRLGEHLKIVCIDVAHGHHDNCLRMIEYVRKQAPGILIIAGNVATPEGANAIIHAGADVIKVGVGPGCFAAGTRILMSNGMYKNIEDVYPGDRIINKNGDPKTVLKSFNTGKRKVARVRNSISYRETYVTPDHKYFVGDLSSVSKTTLQSRGYAAILSSDAKTIPKSSKIKWQEIGASNEVALLVPKSIKFEMPEWFTKYIYIRDGGNGHTSIKNKMDFALTPTYEIGYIFGTFLGDGHATLANNGETDTGAIHWYFGLNETGLADKLKVCIKRVTGRELKVKKKDSVLLCSLYHKPLAEFLATFGKKIEKHLPAKYLANQYGYLTGLHDGLLDSDGHMESGGRRSFKNTSVQLIELFNVITYIITGVFPNNQKDTVSAGNLKNANLENFHTPYVARINNTASKRLIVDYQVAKLLECSDTEDIVDVFDLTVDCETHSFIADNAIVHNSLCTTRVETGNGVPQLTALSNIYDKMSNFKIIADGGIKCAGDLTKALCFSHAVMIGNLVAGTDQAPGEIITLKGQQYKQYAGSSTHKTRNIEGVIGVVPYRGNVVNVIDRLIQGLQSGMSYQGAKDLKSLRNDPEFVEISNAGIVESRPHDIIM